MGYSRYEQRSIFTNEQEMYQKLFDERGVNLIRQYASPNFRYPTYEEYSSLQIQNTVWQVGERYWKIADREYGDPDMWWVIAWFNKKPTEAHNKIGDVILVPRPLEKILTFLGV